MALDSGIAKMGLFAFILLLAFAGLVSIIPAEYNNTITYGNQAEKVPDTWYGVSLGRYNFTEVKNYTLTLTDDLKAFDIGGRNLLLEWDISNIVYTRDLKLSHRYGLFYILGQKEAMDWYNDNNENLGSLISYINLNDDYEDFGIIENKTAFIDFQVICLGLGSGSTYFKVTSILSFNSTAYSSPENAWNNEDLNILIGIGAENANYQQDIWFLISNLLAFNTFYVFGTTATYAVILNGIIAGFIYANVIIFATAVILEVLPF